MPWAIGGGVEQGMLAHVAPVAAGYTLLFCVIPSALLCRSRWSSHLSRVTLYLSLGLLVIILLAWAGFEPLRRQLIFGR